MLPSFSRTASLTSLILSTPCSRMAISTSVSLSPSLSSAVLLIWPSATTTVGGGSISESNHSQRLRSIATARLKTRRMATMIAPPVTDWSGPVIAGCSALATSRTRTRSKVVNCPSSRLPKRRRPKKKMRPWNPQLEDLADAAHPRRILVGYRMPEPEVEQGRRVGEVLRAPQHHDQDRPPVARRGSGQAVTGGACVTGLDADRTRVGREQPIDIDRVEGLVLRGRGDRDLFRRDDGAQVRVVGEQGRPHDGEVVGGAVMIGLIEPARVGEV